MKEEKPNWWTGSFFKRARSLYIVAAIQCLTILVLLALLEMGARMFFDPIAPVDINGQGTIKLM